MTKSRTVAKKRRKPRSPLDPVFKQVLTDEFAEYDAALQTEVEIGRLPRKIDAVLTVATAEERQKIGAETPFFYCLQHNQLEFKGRRDPLTTEGYHAIEGRKHFWFSEEKLSPFAATVTIICASKPQTVFTYAAQLEQPFTAVADGYYKRAGYPPLYLIVLNELPIIPKNYPLLLFAASDPKFREFLECVVVEKNHTYIRYAYEVRPQVTKEVLTMAGISSTLSRSDLKFMAEDIGLELVTFLKPEELLNAMTPAKRRKLMKLFDAKQLLATIPVEERLSGISAEELLKGIRPDQRKALLELLLNTSSANQPEQGETNEKNGHD